MSRGGGNTGMNLDFHKKIVLITGATRGIGKQLAHDFESSGAQLILTGTNKKQIQKLNTKHKNDSNRSYVCVDFLDSDSRDTFLSYIKAQKKIDVCVNNAGINRVNPIWNAKAKDWDDIVQVNLTMPYLISREVSILMKKQRYGRIVNIASIFGVISRQQRSVYTSTKSGLLGMTMSMALDLAPYNVLVNAVSPGFVLTDLTKKILSKAEMRELEDEIPMRRMAQPRDISSAVLFLASEVNSYITGKNLIVDGGYVDV